MAAWYYHVALRTDAAAQTKEALLLVNPSAEIIANAGPVDLLICSRSDVYDRGGTLAEFVKQQNFRKATNLVAFTIWERTQK